VSDYAAQRNEICRIGRSLFARGYVHATAGNISVRLPDDNGFLITPTDACLGQLHPDQLARTDGAGHQTAGPRASKTLALHRAIYAADPAAHCVLHTHSTQLVALTLTGVWRSDRILPLLVAEAITAARQRGAPLRAVMLDRLGPNVWHDSPAAACAVLEELEETARLWRIADGRATALSDAQIEELYSAFGARW
jgi:ribulose-5-phosphate 4-epimerase/fuculose-1-phosphate aldolase